MGAPFILKLYKRDDLGSRLTHSGIFDLALIPFVLRIQVLFCLKGIALEKASHVLPSFVEILLVVGL